MRGRGSGEQTKYARTRITSTETGRVRAVSVVPVIRHGSGVCSTHGGDVAGQQLLDGALARQLLLHELADDGHLQGRRPVRASKQAGSVAASYRFRGCCCCEGARGRTYHGQAAVLQLLELQGGEVLGVRGLSGPAHGYHIITQIRVSESCPFVPSTRCVASSPRLSLRTLKLSPKPRSPGALVA